MIQPVSWLEGYAAHKDGKRLESCPFNHGSDRGEWVDGWYWRARESEGLVVIDWVGVSECVLRAMEDDPDNLPEAVAAAWDSHGE